MGTAPLAIWQDELLARGEPAPALLGFRDADHAPGATLLHNARVATDDGSHGHHGLVTDLLADELDAEPPAVVYACGPPPMLEAVRALCAARDVPCQLALESGMACGFGACFGCVVALRAGGYLRAVRRRAGPRRRAAGGGRRRIDRVTSTSAACAWRTRSSTDRAPSTPSPRGAPSATRCWSSFPFAAFVSKTITLAPRDGNPPPRLYETAAGLINSIGLPNKGLRGYLEQDLPELARLPVPLITNVMGSTAAELCALVEALDERDEVDALELNVSCPNVSTGLDIGADPGELAAVLAEVRPRTAKPLIVKLTPNTADVAARRAGRPGGRRRRRLAHQHAACLCAAPAPRSALPWLGNETGGLSGPAIRAVALAQVRAVAARVSIPVVGMGGVQSGVHAAHMLDAGATLVGVGTESFRDPAAGTRISRELDDLFAKSGTTVALIARSTRRNPCKRGQNRQPVWIDLDLRSRSRRIRASRLPASPAV